MPNMIKKSWTVSTLEEEIATYSASSLRHSIFLYQDSKLLAFLMHAVVHSFPSWLAEIKCTVRVALPKQPIN